MPTEAVIQTGRRAVVIVTEKDGNFSPVEVDVGSEAAGQTEIRKGLEAGQQVVVSGQFLLDSEASLKGAVTRMSAGDEISASAAATPTAPMSTPAMNDDMTNGRRNATKAMPR